MAIWPYLFPDAASSSLNIRKILLASNECDDLKNRLIFRIYSIHWHVFTVYQ